MRFPRPTLLLALGLSALLIADPAFARGGRSGGGSGSGHRSGGHHHHRSHSGIFVGGFFGAPFVYPGWIGAPYGYPLYALPGPVQYIERADEQGAATGAEWFYCRSVNAYFPYVTRCSEAWERVPARPSQE